MDGYTTLSRGHWKTAVLVASSCRNASYGGFYAGQTGLVSTRSGRPDNFGSSGFRCKNVSCPGGAFENRPAVYCWEDETRPYHAVSPVGTTETGPHGFSRPYGTEAGFRSPSIPSDESLGYCQTTLRVEMRAAVYSRFAPMPGRAIILRRWEFGGARGLFHCGGCLFSGG